jgi:hypothetical protein
VTTCTRDLSEYSTGQAPFDRSRNPANTLLWKEVRSLTINLSGKAMVFAKSAEDRLAPLWTLCIWGKRTSPRQG